MGTGLSFREGPWLQEMPWCQQGDRKDAGHREAGVQAGGKECRLRGHSDQETGKGSKVKSAPPSHFRSPHESLK